MKFSKFKKKLKFKEIVLIIFAKMMKIWKLVNVSNYLKKI